VTAQDYSPARQEKAPAEKRPAVPTIGIIIPGPRPIAVTRSVVFPAVIMAGAALFVPEVFVPLTVVSGAWNNAGPVMKRPVTQVMFGQSSGATSREQQRRKNERQEDFPIHAAPPIASFLLD
jgi:hypothetical protein